MITKPGFYKLSQRDYLADPALHRTALHLFSRSGKHLQEGSEETHYMRIGSAWHWINLEPKKYAKRVKEKKTGWSEWKGDDLHIKTVDIQILKEMKKAFWQKKTTRKIFKNAHAKELSCFWELWTGQMAKAKLDIITEDENGPLIVDLKKTKDANREAFYWNVMRYKYHWQAALSLEGVSKVTGIEHYRFAFACTEATPPYETCFHLLEEDWLELAWKQMRPVIEEFGKQKNQGHWEGYPDELTPLSLRR